LEIKNLFNTHQNGENLMSKMKTTVAMGALLLGAAYAAGEPLTNQDSDVGEYSVGVQDIRKVWVSDNSKASKNDANEVIQAIGANTASSPLVLEFTVQTNLEEWDLSLEATNGGKLLRTGDNVVPLTTDAPGHDGSLGNGGSLYVLLKDAQGGPLNVSTGLGADVNVNSLVTSLASAVFGETIFENPELVTAVFEIRAGLGGTKIIAPPGTYTETVTLTLTGNTN